MSSIPQLPRQQADGVQHLHLQPRLPDPRGQVKGAADIAAHQGAYAQFPEPLDLRLAQGRGLGRLGEKVGAARAAAGPGGIQADGLQPRDPFQQAVYRPVLP